MPSTNITATVKLSASQGVEAVVRDLDGNPTSIFRKIGISLTALSDPLVDIPLLDYLNLLEFAAEETQEPAFGLRFAKRFDLNDLGPLIYFFRHHQTLLEAISAFEQHFPALQTHSRYAFSYDDNSATISYSTPLFERGKFRQDADFSILLHIRCLQILLGEQWMPERIEFAHDAPEQQELYTPFLKTEISFGAKTNKIVFPSCLLSTKNKNSDQQLVSIISRYLTTSISTNQHQNTTESVVRTIVSRALEAGEPFNRQVLCGYLNLSARGLHTILARESLSFRQILIEEAMKIAKHQLTNTDRPIHSIAEQLGFSETSSFTRSFSRQLGLPPSRFRRALDG